MPPKRRVLSPARSILLGFAALIVLGTLLLSLPFATASGQRAPLFTAFFTSCSATCVTGMVLQDTAAYWSVFGQAVILALVQIGGMGVITIAVAASLFTGKEISLRQRWTMQQSISAPNVGGIIQMTGFILRASFLIELLGTVLLAVRFVPAFGLGRGLWYSLFHSISAFCNAGFDLFGTVYGPGSSLSGLAGDPFLLFCLMALIIVGGIGFLTWVDVWFHRRRFREYSLQSKLVLATTAVLLLGGFLYFYFFEFAAQPQWAGLSTGQRLLNALFQSVTARTAGFTVVDPCTMSEPSRLATMALAMVGGASGSTASGMKVGTLAVMFLCIRSVVMDWESAHAFGRRITDETLRAAACIFTLYMLMWLGGALLLCGMNDITLLEGIFEAGSAVSTVGITLNVTQRLTRASQILLMLLMYFGRMGGLTMIYAFAFRPQRLGQYPQENMSVG